MGKREEKYAASPCRRCPAPAIFPGSLPTFHPNTASCSQSLGGAGDRGSVTGSHCPLQNPQAHSPAKEVPTGPTRPASQQEIVATCWREGAVQQMTVAEPRLGSLLKERKTQAKGSCSLLLSSVQAWAPSLVQLAPVMGVERSKGHRLVLGESLPKGRDVTKTSVPPSREPPAAPQPVSSFRGCQESRRVI